MQTKCTFSSTAYRLLNSAKQCLMQVCLAVVAVAMMAVGVNAQGLPASDPCANRPVITGDGTTASVSQLAAFIADSGITVVSSSYTGAVSAVGTFTNGNCMGSTVVTAGVGNGIEEGVILSTGHVRNLVSRDFALQGIDALHAANPSLEPPLPQSFTRRADGVMVTLTNTFVDGSGVVHLPDGTAGREFPTGTVVTSDGVIRMPNGKFGFVDFGMPIPAGAVFIPAGSLLRADNSVDFGGAIGVIKFPKVGYLDVPTPVVLDTSIIYYPFGLIDYALPGVVMPGGPVATATMAFSSDAFPVLVNGPGGPVTVNFTAGTSAILPAGSVVSPNLFVILPDGSSVYPNISEYQMPAGSGVNNADNSVFLPGGVPFSLPANYDSSYAFTYAGQDGLISAANGTPGDTLLDQLIGSVTIDAATLQILFTTPKPWIEMTYVFTSDEYNEYVHQPFNDTFSFFLNGSNVALLPNSEIPVSINSVNNGSDSDPTPTNERFYIDNTDHHIATEMDGMTVVMKVVAQLRLDGQPNIMRMSVADVLDEFGDTNVLLKAHSLKGIDDPRGNPAFDQDRDGIFDPQDNCPFVANPDQIYTPTVGSLAGDACRDRDGDGILDVNDVCPLFADPTNSSAACRNAVTPVPVLSFTELNGSGCVLTNVDGAIFAGPWGNTTSAGAPTFSFSIVKDPADAAKMKLTLSYTDPGPAAAPLARTIQINNQSTGAFVPFDENGGLGLKAVIPCQMTQGGNAGGPTTPNSICALTIVDIDGGHPPLVRPAAGPFDRFQVIVPNGPFAPYTSGDFMNVSCYDLLAVLPPPPLADNAGIVQTGQSKTVDVMANDSSPNNFPLTLSAITVPPAHGTAQIVVVAGKQQIQYTANVPGFGGEDTLTYQVKDTHLGLGTAVMTIIVNRPPTAINDSVAIQQGGNVNIAVLSNDADPDLDTLNVGAFTNPTKGTVLKVGNTFTYTATPGQFGTDTFTYTVDDGRGGSATATVTITINRPPTAVADSVGTGPNTPVTISVLTNDSDPDGDTVSVTGIVAGPLSGTAIVNANGTITYTPNAGFSGIDTLTYSISDGRGGTAMATVTITLNVAPVAVDDAYSTSEDTPLTVSIPGILTNDSDADPLTVLTVSPVATVPPATGTLTLLPNGSFVYVPAPNFSGVATFTYKANDLFVSSNTATVTITVNPVNDPPVAVNDSYTVNEDTTLTVLPAQGLLLNDSDIDSTALSVVLISTPPDTQGILTVNPDGSLTFVPAPNFNGTVTFTYKTTDGTLESNLATVTLKVNPVNDVPVANNDAYSGNSGAPLVISAAGGILGNDTDVDVPTTLTVAAGSVTAPLHGTVTVNANGSFTYTSAAGYVGPDSFTYKATDGSAISNVATVNITVNQSLNRPPVAVADTVSTRKNYPVTINVLSNDTDPDGDTLTIVSATTPLHGTVAIVNGKIVYTPAYKFQGTDTFTYTITDGKGGTSTATVTVKVGETEDDDEDDNRPPDAKDDLATTLKNTPVTINVLANDSDPDNDTLTLVSASSPANGTVAIVGGKIVYTPEYNFSGSDSFTYKVSDGHGGTDTAVVRITVSTSTNHPPNAVDDAVTTAKDSAVTINVLANDSDPDGDVLSITAASSPGHGVAVIVSGKIVYTPAANFSGTDCFTYTISDGKGGTDQATVRVTVAGSTSSNHAPDARDDYATTLKNTPVTINVLPNDTDIDGDVLTISYVSTPGHGTATLVNGKIVYTPANNFYGTDCFTYKISDGKGGTDIATVRVTVSGSTNNPPNANDDTASTAKNTAVTINVLGNDSDPDGNALSIVSVSVPEHGVATIVSGKVVYTPTTGYSGYDCFTYKISDGKGGTDQASVKVTVTSTSPSSNHAPYAHDDSVSTAKNTPVTINVLSNDTDRDNDSLALTSVSGASHGTASIVSGKILYIPATGYEGTDSFTYKITDGHGGVDEGKVTVKIGERSNGSCGDWHNHDGDDDHNDEDGGGDDDHHGHHWDDQNHAPVALNDTATTVQGSALTINVLANDSDSDGNLLGIASISTPAHGTAVPMSGKIVYTPTAGYVGTDSFTYTISDGKGGVAIGSVTVTVTAGSKTLTVARSGSGTGVVSGTGINCGTDCSESFSASQSVTLTAAASSGSYFAGWSGACSGTGACTLTMSDNRSVTASFATVRTLNVTKSGSGAGTVSGTGIACGTDCTESYTTTSPTVALTAVAATGSVFTGWSGACTGTGTCSLTMTDSRAVTASFATVTTSGHMTGGGNLTSSDGKSKVTHGFTLRCDMNDKKADKNLEVNWDGGNKFKLETVTSMKCYDDPAIGPQQPQSGFDTMIGTATGKYNGQAATIEFKINDCGEPGTNDITTMVIRKGSTEVLTVNGKITGGNHQAHKN